MKTKSSNLDCSKCEYSKVVMSTYGLPMLVCNNPNSFEYQNEVGSYIGCGFLRHTKRHKRYEDK